MLVKLLEVRLTGSDGQVRGALYRLKKTFTVVRMSPVYTPEPPSKITRIYLHIRQPWERR